MYGQYHGVGSNQHFGYSGFGRDRFGFNAIRHAGGHNGYGHVGGIGFDSYGLGGDNAHGHRHDGFGYDVYTHN